MRRLPVRTLACALALAFVGGGAAVAAAQRPSLLGLEPQFMCLSCHEPLQLVSSPQAQAEKGEIARLIARGETDAQIKRSMVAQYGEAVLALPPASGFDLTLYVLPPAFLLIGVAGLLYTLPKWRERSRRATALEQAPPLAEADAARLDEELSRFI